MWATTGWFWGIWISIVSNNTVRAAATLAYRAIDMIVKVSIDSYLDSNSVKTISNRLSFEQHIFTTVDQYVLMKVMGLQ